MRARRSAVMGLALVVAACGVATDPERGPVILSCTGSRTVNAADGEREIEPRHETYRVDGITRTFEEWDDESQGFRSTGKGLTVSPSRITFSEDMPTLAGIASVRTVTFDRMAGSVVDENLFSNGGRISFDARCEPVRRAASRRAF